MRSFCFHRTAALATVDGEEEVEETAKNKTVRLTLCITCTIYFSIYKRADDPFSITRKTNTFQFDDNL